MWIESVNFSLSNCNWTMILPSKFKFALILLQFNFLDSNSETIDDALRQQVLGLCLQYGFGLYTSCFEGMDRCCQYLWCMLAWLSLTRPSQTWFQKFLQSVQRWTPWLLANSKQRISSLSSFQCCILIIKKYELLEWHSLWTLRLFLTSYPRFYPWMQPSLDSKRLYHLLAIDRSLAEVVCCKTLG